MYLEIPQAFHVKRTVHHGFEMLKRQPLGLIIGALMLGLFGRGCQVSASSTGQAGTLQASVPGLEGVPPWALLLGVLGAGACLQTLAMLFQCFLLPGYLRLHRQIIVEGSGSVGQLFAGASAFPRMVMWRLLRGTVLLLAVGLAATPGALLLIIGSLTDNATFVAASSWIMGIPAIWVAIYVGLGLSLGDYAVCLDNLGPFGALVKSWRLVSEHRSHLLVYYIVTAVVRLLGWMFCCVGAIATTPIVDAGMTEGYLIATCDDWDSFALIKAVGDF